MSLKAIIPSGVTEIIVNGLHQWDYGQELEIHCDDIPAIVEVHFACFGMIEADVRTCTVANGVAKVSIPDLCIEQTTPITAWVYCINGTSARTAITITLPIIARAKPAPSASVPTVISDKYTELVAAINEQVSALSQGEVMAARARTAVTAETSNHANTADSATTATNATNAQNAINAENATNAKNAEQAITAESASSFEFNNSCISCQITDGVGVAPDELEYDVIYVVRFEEVNTSYSGICCFLRSKEANTFSLGRCAAALVTGGGARAIYVNENDNSYGNGTLKFFKLGEVS